MSNTREMQFKVAKYLTASKEGRSRFLSAHNCTWVWRQVKPLTDIYDSNVSFIHRKIADGQLIIAKRMRLRKRCKISSKNGRQIYNMKYEIQGNVRQPQRMAFNVLIAMCYGCSSSANMQYVGHDTPIPPFAY